MEDTQYFSQIRIGNRVVYNGVNGDAFSFGEKPPTVSGDSRASEIRSVADNKSSPANSTDASKRSSTQEARGTSSSVRGCELPMLDEDRHALRTLPSSVSEMKSFSSPLGNKHQSHPLKGLSRGPPMSASPFPLAPQSPATVGLPPILPPPPAAHLPPPLPSRPPSAVPSPSSSLSSLLSYKNDEKSLTTPPLSPSQSSEAMNADENSAGNGTSFRNFFFRTSGTIKVEAPSRDLLHSPPHPPLSPPPLPMPHTLASSSSFATSPPLTTPKPARISNSRRSSESQASSEATAATTMPASPVPTPQFYPAPSSSQNDSEEDEADVFDNYDGAAISNCRFQPTADQRPEGSLVARRDSENVFSKRKPSSASEKNDPNRQIIPPEFESIRKQSMTYADVISSVLMYYKLSKGSQKKKLPYTTPKLEKASLCKKCERQFGFTRFRYHCSRCKKAFCDSCIPVVRVDNVEQEERASSLSRVCDTCSEEIAYETSRGTYRGLWSEFKKLRDEARAHRGLDVTSSNIHRSLESQTMLDVTPGLTSLCLRFLVDVHHQLEKQPRHKFLANYLHFENPGQNRIKSKITRSKECQACNRQLRMLTEIHDCSLCDQTFCISCTYRTLQLYLPPGTDLKGDISIDWIQFHVKNDEMEDGRPSEVSETYRVCADCEDTVMRNFLIYDFNRKIPELEAEMFDLQRQIDHALTYDPQVHGMRRWASAHNLYHGNQQETMATNVKLANRLYVRYMRAYDTLNHMEPQTSGQKTLHKHIKQAMYDFYLKRRDQLNTTLGRDDSRTNNETP